MPIKSYDGGCLGIMSCTLPRLYNMPTWTGFQPLLSHLWQRKVFCQVRCNGNHYNSCITRSLSFFSTCPPPSNLQPTSHPFSSHSFSPLHQLPLLAWPVPSHSFRWCFYHCIVPHWLNFTGIDVSSFPHTHAHTPFFLLFPYVCTSIEEQRWNCCKVPSHFKCDKSPSLKSQVRMTLTLGNNFYAYCRNSCPLNSLLPRIVRLSFFFCLPVSRVHFLSVAALKIACGVCTSNCHRLEGYLHADSWNSSKWKPLLQVVGCSYAIPLALPWGHTAIPPPKSKPNKCTWSSMATGGLIVQDSSSRKQICCALPVQGH